MAIDVNNILIGPWRSYLGGTAPTDGSGLAMTAGVPDGFTDVGLTEGELTPKITPSIVEIKGVQRNGILNVYASDEEMEIGFTLKEVQNFDILKKLVMTGTDFTDVVLTPNQKILGVGGINEIATSKIVPWAFVTKRPYQSSALYFYICLFQAILTGDISWAFSKEKESVIPITLKPIADPARTAGRDSLIIGYEYAT